MNTFTLGLVLFCAIAGEVKGHGRLLKPPGRSSLHRLREFDYLNIPWEKKNYGDNQLFCGGRVAQYVDNGGQCGVCGDDFSEEAPRPNELGGFYDPGVIGATYTAGQVIDVHVELTATHLGHFEFRLCAELPEEQSCLDKHLLEVVGTGVEGETKVPVDNEIYHYYPQLKLPEGVTCEHCTFQWHYRTGNDWGECEDGSQGVGCGNQETFRGCADIAIQ